MIALKEGVRLLGIRPELVMAVFIVERIYDEAGWTLIVTSVVDGQHMRNSLHYVGAAFDFNPPQRDVAHFRALIANALGSDYDVVIESDHMHIEWQPEVGV